MLRVIRLVFLLVLCWLICGQYAPGQVVRIMPMGNSITYDENLFDVEPNIRPASERTSYRFDLYKLLKQAGYVFDFTGSENAGNDYFQNPEMDDNAGFPGITDNEMADLIRTGYNDRTSTQVTPGPYLLSYPCDIILLHIGTNAVDESPDDVEEILDNIRFYDNDVIILVARIINRNTYSQVTTTFNDNVEAMVAARHDDKIISVNMETGAGIDYDTDMMDIVHPNRDGYDKMAAKWFEAIENLNTSPVIDNIPQQITNEGSSFVNLSLDNYISDAEDEDNKIGWTFRQPNPSKLSVILDADRILHVSVPDTDWNGSETIRLIAEDSGNGAFSKKDSVDVMFTVNPVNDPPVILSTPALTSDEDAPYSYTVMASDVESGNVLTYSASPVPEWMQFNAGTHILSGTPANENVGVHEITIHVSDGSTTTDQHYHLEVYNLNDLPVITSQPLLSVLAKETYMYEFTATDIDAGDNLSFSAVSIPDWLHFTAGSVNGLLYGTPLQTNLGDFAIILLVDDGESSVLQGFTIAVSALSPVEKIGNSLVRQIYPNPAIDKVIFKFDHATKTILEIYDITGTLKKKAEADYVDMYELDISDLSKGIYLYKIHQNDKTNIGKIIKADTH